MMGQTYLSTIGIIFLFMCYVFILAQIFKNNSIVDIFWGLGFVVVIIYFTLNSNSYIERQAVLLTKHLVNLCVIIWGLRLAVYIYTRNKGKGEDWRYINFRKLWTKHNIPQWLGAFLQVFMLQGFFMFIVSLPVIHVNASFSGINFLTIVGLIIWIIGFVFEALGDYQLAAFKKNLQNKGKIMRYGLWKYTRHPNYFGEMTMWWGIWLMSVNFFTPVQTIISIISPLTITWLLTKVSGVPMLESKYKNDAEYMEYVKNTPSFFPKFRR